MGSERDPNYETQGFFEMCAGKKWNHCTRNAETIIHVALLHTVEPPNKGHFGTSHYRDVVLILRGLILRGLKMYYCYGK